MKKTLGKIYVVIVIVVVLASVIVTAQLTDLDEIWNYNFARNVAIFADIWERISSYENISNNIMYSNITIIK